MKLTRSTQFMLEGRGKLQIGPQNYIATGGEASVYRTAGTVVKLYTDPQKLAHPGMLDNLRSLSALRHPYVVSPQGLVSDGYDRPLGYYMPYVADGEALSSVFTNDFRKRSGFSDVEARALVQQMFEVMHFAHSNGTVMVDPNELNWTTVPSGSGTHREPRVFDVDSWLVGNYRPPTVPMMPSIRDWQTPGVNERTDRFALAVVTFMVLTGIHPYKGTLDGYKRSELERRMRDNASVFLSEVRLNQAVRDFTCIPRPWYDWYEGVFQHGDRSAPPMQLQPGAAPPFPGTTRRRVSTTATGKLVYTRLLEAVSGDIVRVFPCGIAQLSTGRLVHVETGKALVPASLQCEVVRVDGGWLIADPQENGMLAFRYIGENGASVTLSLDIAVSRLVRYQNRLFGVTGRGLTELTVVKFGQPIISAGLTWQVLVDATTWFDGLGVFDAMGATHLVVPFGSDSCAHVRVPELDHLKVVAAKAGSRFVSVIAVDAKGLYQKIELTFSARYDEYTAWRGDADTPELNMSLLPRGVVATIVRDGELVIFVPTTNAVNRISDRDATTGIQLENWNERVVFIRDGQLWQVAVAT